MKLYLIFSLFSYIVRTFLMFNPFESFGENAVGINMIFGGLLIPFTFGMVALFVSNVDNHLVKSAFFLILYIMNNLFLKIAFYITHNLEIAMIIFLLEYALIIFMYRKINNEV